MESDWTQICIDCVDPVRRGDMYLHGCYFPANMNKEVAKDLVMKTAENGRAIASQQTGEGKVYVWYLPPDLAAETEIIQMAVVVKEGRIHSATPSLC